MFLGERNKKSKKNNIGKYPMALVLLAFMSFLLGINPVAMAKQAAKQNDSNQKAPSTASDLSKDKISEKSRDKSNAPKKLNPKDKERISRRDLDSLAEYHFSLAQAYSGEGELDRAIEEYQLALVFDPHSALIYARLSAEYVKKGMLSAALESTQEALKKDPKFIDARLILAGLYSAMHESKLAIQEYDRVLKQDSKNEEAVVFKSQVLVEEGRNPEAIEALRKFVKSYPDSPVAYFYLARSEEQENHFQQAVTAYKKAISLRQNFTQAVLGLGQLYEQMQKLQDAISVYQTLYETSQEVSVANRLANLYLKKDDYAKAVPYLKSVTQSDPEDLNARVKLGLIQMDLKQYESSIKIFSEILEKNPESDRIQFYLGNAYELNKQNDKALHHFKKIDPSSSLYSDATLHCVNLVKQTSGLVEARAYLLESTVRAPMIRNFYIYQASLEEDDRKLEKAIQILEGALEKFPKDERIQYYLGTLYDRTGQVDKSLEKMESILKVNPENVDALNYLGYTWTIQGVRLGEAGRVLKKALQLRPQNGYIQDSWGWYLLTMGKTREAIVELEKAAKLKPKEATILEHLADAYLKSNLRQKAQVKYEEAVQYADSEEIKKKIENKIENVKRELARQTGPNTRERLPASR